MTGKPKTVRMLSEEKDYNGRDKRRREKKHAGEKEGGETIYYTRSFFCTRKNAPPTAFTVGIVGSSS